MSISAQFVSFARFFSGKKLQLFRDVSASLALLDQPFSPLADEKMRSSSQSSTFILKQFDLLEEQPLQLLISYHRPRKY